MRLMIFGSTPGGHLSFGGHLKLIAADWMVIFLCASSSRKSVVVLRSSTSRTN